MSEIATSNIRDAETGQFLKGYRGGGRKPGSRNKLGEHFLSALADDFVPGGGGDQVGEAFQSHDCAVMDELLNGFLE